MTEVESPIGKQTARVLGGEASQGKDTLPVPAPSPGPPDGLEKPASPPGGPGGAGYPAVPSERLPGPLPPPPRARRGKGLIIGIAAALVALAGAGIGVAVAVHEHSANGISLPSRLLGMPRLHGPGAQADEALLARQAVAGSNGFLVHAVAGLYGNAGGGIAVAVGPLCGTCTIKPASLLAKGMLADSPAGARAFQPGPGGGALVCFSYSALGQTALICYWLRANARIAGTVGYLGGAASGLADAAAKTRQIIAAIGP